MTPDELAKAGTEHAHQRALFAWASMAAKYGFEAANDSAAYLDKSVAYSYWQKSTAYFPVLNRLFAVPNGGERHKAVAGKLKAEGAKKGVPDVMLPLPSYPYHGLFIEMKKPGELKGTSTDQKDWIRDLRSLGYFAVVRDNWRSAAATIQTYLTSASTLRIENEPAL